jgi:hypothetical protein
MGESSTEPNLTTFRFGLEAVLHMLKYARLHGRSSFKVPSGQNTALTGLQTSPQDVFLSQAALHLNVVFSRTDFTADRVAQKLRKLGQAYENTMDGWNQCLSDYALRVRELQGADENEGRSVVALGKLVTRQAQKLQGLRQKMAEANEESDSDKALAMFRALATSSGRQTSNLEGRQVVDEFVCAQTPTDKEVIKQLFIAMTDADRPRLLADLGMELTRIGGKDEKSLGKLVHDCIVGARNLEARNIRPMIHFVSSMAAERINQLEAWRLIPHLLENVKLSVYADVGTAVIYTDDWKLFERSAFNVIGGGNKWKFFRGKRCEGDGFNSQYTSVHHCNFPFRCESSLQKEISAAIHQEERAGMVFTGVETFVEAVGNVPVVTKCDKVMLNYGCPSKSCQHTNVDPHSSLLMWVQWGVRICRVPCSSASLAKCFIKKYS